MSPHSRCLWIVFCLCIGLLEYGCAKSLHLPPFIKACSRNDPNLNECALKHGREALPEVLKGDPRINLPPLDPLHIPEVRVDRSGRGVGAIFINRDIKVTGLKNTVLEKVNLDLKKRKIESWYSLPRLEINSKYEIKGRVLVLPIEGNGNSNFTLVGNKLYHWFTYDLIDRNGERFMTPTGEDLKVNTTRAYFYLTNLFNGDKALGDNMNKFLNENWREVLDDIGPDIVLAVRKVMEALVAGVLNNFSYDTVVPEKV